MEKIEFTATVKIGEAVIDAIEVHPMLFFPLIDVWEKANNAPGNKPEVALQRARMKYQTHFKVGADRIAATDADIQKLPRTVASAILKLLDKGQGPLGKILAAGDGCTTPVVYQLGTPVEMKKQTGETVTISDLEFMAETYGEVEDILAAANDLAKAGELIKRLGKPIGSNLALLPGWALDRLTVADGIQVMRLVLPSF